MSEIMDSIISFVSQWWTTLLPAFGGSSAFVYLYFYFYRNAFTFWSKKGLKNPFPLPFCGNLINLLSKDFVSIQPKWSKLYGKVYGAYICRKPILIVSDAETLIQLTVKDFDVLPNHKNDASLLGKYGGQFIFNAVDDKWRRLRALTSPTFTSAKIKRMYKLLSICSDDIVACINESNQDENGLVKGINSKQLFNLYSMDGILTCCYGLRLERAGSSNLKGVCSRNEFVKLCLNIFDRKFLRIACFFMVPEKILKFFKFSAIPESALEPVAERVQQMINSRRQSGKKHDDYLQLLLDAKVIDKLDLDTLDSEENHHIGSTSDDLQKTQKKMALELKKGQLTDEEILVGAVFLMAVGLETTAVLLSNCVYVLAYHKEIQERLYNELMKIGKQDEKTKLMQFDYEALTSCRYLDSFIAETLRHRNVVPLMHHQLKYNYRLEKYKLNLPADLEIQFNFAALHYDPDYWVEPEKFDPERFMPGNREKIVPGSYCPFGLGPRHCIGMRFSLTEAKVGLAKVVTNFLIEPAPGTKFPPKSRGLFGPSSIDDPRVIFKARN